MWVAEFKVWHRNSDINEKTLQFDATMACYYLNAYVEKGKVHASKVMIATGPQKNEIIEALSKDKSLRVHAVEGTQIFYDRRVSRGDYNDAYHSIFMDKSVFFLKPMTVKKGFQYWVLGSWDKKNLMRVYKKLKAQKGFATIELMSLKKEKVNIFSTGVLNTLTEKELEALKIAVQWGYYGSPRKISLEDLCKNLKIARTTFRASLRSAEKKALKGLLEQVVVW